jgi:hypothetical protein
MSEKRPKPLLATRVNHRCPVCGQISYSRAGIHPQCAARQEDEKRKSRMKQEKPSAQAKKPAIPASGVPPWRKVCPKCNTLQHARKTVCRCGHTFAVRGRPPKARRANPSG